jgi:hypothetical protein
MNHDLVQWLREQAHELVRLARTLNADAAGKLEAIAVEMLNRALDLEKADSL